MKKTFILLVVFLSVCAIFVSGIDHVYADNGKGSRTGDSGKNENVTSNETLNSSSSSNAASNTTSSTKDSSELESDAGNTATWLDNTDKISCGPIKGMSKSIPRATSLVVLFIEILTPALLIVFGMLDFYKAIASGVDENIKKNRNAFFNRIVAAIIVFLIIAVTKLLVSVVSRSQGNDGSGTSSCINCFINNKCGG